MKKKIWGNTIVKNEDKFLWFGLMSVIDFLDKILIWDTDSKDKTVDIIKDVNKRKPGKIIFEKLGPVDEKKFSNLRQKMLEQTKSDWFFVLDGDEVWWERSVKRVINKIHQTGHKLDFIVTPFYSIIGDIYHYQEKEAGKYNLVGKKGHLNIRAINRKIPGLHVDKPYGQEGFFDGSDKPIQERDIKRQMFLEAPYLHFSNISRSNLKEGDEEVMQRIKKIKHEIGIGFPPGFVYPEVLHMDIPHFVSTPWKKMSRKFAFKAYLQTPLRKIKRRLK